ncbi:MAG TPA: DUF5666 domain-containing protein [Candidatus Acidoferrum sp.]|jgi:hypothetical protein
MRSRSLLALFALAAVLPLTSCSGVKSACTVNCGGGGTGNATVSMTIYASASSSVNVLSMTLPVIGVSLTPATGNPVAVSSTTTNFEMTRLQTDSSLVEAGATVPAGTYTAISVTLAGSSGIFINATNAAMGTCGVGAVCNLPASAATTVTFTFPTPLALAANQSQWIGLNFNLNSAITNTNGVSVSFSNTGVFTAATTPRRGLPTGAVDTIEDFVGVVTAFTSNSISVKSGISGQTLTAAINGNTAYDAPSTSLGYTQCAQAPSCIKVGSTVSVDAALAAVGTLTATEVDVLDATSVDEVEGVVYPTATAGTFGLIVSDKVVTSSNAALTALTIGSPIFLTAGSNPIGYIDTKTLSIPLNSITGFTSNLVAGQQVRVQVSSAAVVGTATNVMANNFLLRFSRFTATVAATGTTFTITNLPAYITALNTSLPQTPQVATYLNYTLFDGLSNTTDPVFVTGSTVSVRALYLNNTAPAFQAAKVRVP